MSQTIETQQPSPTLFFETLTSYQRTEALKAAIELDVFTALVEGANTVEALARQCRASERGMRILCDYLVLIGFLTKQDDRYGLTGDSSAFLNRKSPAYVGTAVRFLSAPVVTEGFKNLVAAVRHGGCPDGEQGLFAPEHPIWMEFARGMAPVMTLPAELIAKMLGTNANQKTKVLDIAAGHGLFGIALAKYNPNAEVFAVDWPQVLTVAKENAQAAGVASRYHTIPGNAFEVDYGSDYDIVLITNFLHGFNLAACERLLRKVYAALKPGGRAVALEFVPNEDRVSPPIAASFSLNMLVNTAGGDAYTASELERMFHSAGFSRTAVRALPPTPHHTIISQKLAAVAALPAR